MAEIEEILRFWFEKPQTEASTYKQRRKVWFGKNLAVDQEIRDRFQDTYDQAVTGQLDHWQETPAGALALIVVLDQFPRNMFRDRPEAFASDARALAVAQGAIARGFDQEQPPVQRLFFYLPFEHSENLEQQHRSVELTYRLVMEAPELADCYDYAVRHRDVIARFGRFPHRNRILGRDSTPDEVEFLRQPGSSF